ncbi:MAG: hypothetical protein LBV22_03110 [Mycoplasmataceae bacterium]|nr:hypothetical protein [Mycoplasmataceae bacterium]
MDYRKSSQTDGTHETDNGGYVTHHNSRNDAGRDRNWAAITGFICAFGSMIPFIGSVAFVCSIVFSSMGLKSQKRGLAIAGLCISIGLVVIGFLIVLAIFGLLAAGATAAPME